MEVQLDPRYEEEFNDILNRLWMQRAVRLCAKGAGRLFLVAQMRAYEKMGVVPDQRESAQDFTAYCQYLGISVEELITRVADECLTDPDIVTLYERLYKDGNDSPYYDEDDE